MKTILAPIDFSDRAPLVIAEAALLARAIDARLMLLHVIQPVVGTASEFGYAEATDRIATAAVKDAAQRLAHLQQQLSSRGIPAAVLHVMGVPGAAIVARAREYHADYIVIGSHGHGAFYELLVGSTASRVINEATCPVMVVPSHSQPNVYALALDLEPAGDSEKIRPLAVPAQQ